MDNTQNIISFCTGYGGIELGLRRAGVDVRVVCNVEIEAFVQANLVAKTEQKLMANCPIYTDLETFPARIFRGKICGVIGGYPCQPFSSAGKRKGEKDPRHLWPYIRQHIRAIRPVWCFFENVRGHTTIGLWRVLSDLEEDGYRTEWGLFSAEETGAPHQRIRVFILARLGDSDVRYERSHEFKRGVLSAQTEDRQASGFERTSDTRQLGDPKHDGSPTSGDIGKFQGESDGTQKAFEQSSGASESELAHTASREPRQSQARNGGQDIGGGSEEELADCDNQRCDREQISVQSGRSQQEGAEIMRSSRATRWPARSGEEQYEWEEPRVTEAQSELGGAVDGLTHRVDRLRLLGNGVVPQTAELAWRTLWQRI